MLKFIKHLSITAIAERSMIHTSSKRTQTIAIPQKDLPELPIELILEIFEIAVRLSHESAATISLVSSWARKIAAPHLFSTIVNRNAPLTPAQVANASKYSQAPASRSPLPAHLGQFVHHLWTERAGMFNIANEVELFRACPNVEHLALSSPSLQALSMTCQMHRKTSAEPAFPSSLRSITMLSPTYRYEWHFLVGARVPNGGLLLHSITHLRLLEMGPAMYAPHAHLPNLTHLAVPHLAGLTLSHEPIRLPDGVLQHRRIQMVVLTMDERNYLTAPWYEIRRLSFGSTSSSRKSFGSMPSNGFRDLVRRAQHIDERVYVVLSPRVEQDACAEWEAVARGGESIWEAALRAREDETYGVAVPRRSTSSGSR